MEKAGSIIDEEKEANRPRVDFISLEKTDDYDFFPNIDDKNYTSKEIRCLI